RGRGRTDGSVPSRARSRKARGSRAAASAFERPTNVVEILERLERPSLSPQVLGQARAGEDALGRERRATIRVAVADVHECPVGEAGALAPVAADLARLRARPANSPAVRTRVEAVRAELDFDSLAGKQRADQLLEPAREDERIVSRHQLVEAGTDPSLARQPGRDTLQARILHGRELGL